MEVKSFAQTYILSAPKVYMKDLFSINEPSVSEEISVINVDDFGYWIFIDHDRRTHSCPET